MILLILYSFKQNETPALLPVSPITVFNLYQYNFKLYLLKHQLKWKSIVIMADWKIEFLLRKEFEFFCICYWSKPKKENIH